jgi:hypothetical protein
MRNLAGILRKKICNASTYLVVEQFECTIRDWPESCHKTGVYETHADVYCHRLSAPLLKVVSIMPSHIM